MFEMNILTMKTIYVFLADGFEEIEAMIPIDVLRRAGLNVVIASVNDSMVVQGAHGVSMIADKTIDEVKEGDMIVLPGGMPGATNLDKCPELNEQIMQYATQGKPMAAICAAPSVVLGLLPNLEGRKMTCYDGFEEALTEKGVEYVKEGVVIDGNIITGRGPGWAVDFGLAILSHVKGQETADKVKAGLML
jgi:4-methyl-5(b-hydroxyethyl)-thiazole monophosphate biosynthesis